MSTAFTYRGIATYHQKEFAVKDIHIFAKRIGKTAFVICGNTAWSVVGEHILSSLRSVGIKAIVAPFKGFCTMSHIDLLYEKFHQSGADFLIGIGGGRAIDVAKGVALKSGAPFILVPTSVSQCACCANVIVMYEDNGDPSPTALHLDHAAYAVIVDTDIIVRHCPARMFATGIADAMAKLPEIQFLRAATEGWEDSFFSDQSYQMGIDAYNLYQQFAAEAYQDVIKKNITNTVERLITTNLLLTGFASAMAAGTRQIAFAHNLYYAVCLNNKEQVLRYMHGEVVSAALTWQFAINGASHAEIMKCRALLDSIGMPTSVKDLGIVSDERFRQNVLSYCRSSMAYLSDEHIEKAKNCMDVL